MSEAEVLFRVEGGAGIITLNRPQVLNALTHPMVAQMDRQLIAWAADPAVKIVIVEGAGEKAFCAGGDIKSVALAVKDGGAARAEAAEFFRAEYTLNHRIHTYPKPYIALAGGIVMGGGVGVSAHGAHRVVSENTLFAMPETTIGFFCDVGAGYMLPRFPGQTGAYLGLTSKRIKAADALYVGFATHHVPFAQFSALRAALAAAPDKIDETLKSFSTPPADAPALPAHRALIDRCFAVNHVEEIVSLLELDGSDFANEALHALRAVSPSSLKIVLRQIRLGAKMDFADVMTMEYRLSQACLDRPDFYEGVRAALIDKDRQPRWNPSRLEEVSDVEIEACFHSLGSQDLVL